MAARRHRLVVATRGNRAQVRAVEAAIREQASAKRERRRDLRKTAA
jgi:hypothetical protein